MQHIDYAEPLSNRGVSFTEGVLSATATLAFRTFKSIAANLLIFCAPSLTSQVLHATKSQDEVEGVTT